MILSARPRGIESNRHATQWRVFCYLWIVREFLELVAGHRFIILASGGNDASRTACDEFHCYVADGAPMVANTRRDGHPWRTDGVP